MSLEKTQHLEENAKQISNLKYLSSNFLKSWLFLEFFKSYKIE